MSLGWLLALLVLIAALVLVLASRMDLVEAAMFAALALAILLGPVTLPWRVPAA